MNLINVLQGWIIIDKILVNAGLEQSDTDSFQDSSLKLNVRSGQSRSSSMLSESSSQSPEIHPFFKDSFGKFIVLYSYHAQDENDLSVERGQLVTLLNKVRLHLYSFSSPGKIFCFHFYCSRPRWWCFTFALTMSQKTINQYKLILSQLTTASHHLSAACEVSPKHENIHIHDTNQRLGLFTPDTLFSFVKFCRCHLSSSVSYSKYFLRWNILQDDPEWLWVVRGDGHEGFVPSGFIYPLDAIQKQRE